MNNVMRIARKEFATFFASLTAFLFFGAFLFVTLFVFFWVDTFFARNIADARPMFEWMPTLLILLAPALTMRMWSEERRSGTLELLMTAPISNVELVLGKFLACLALVGVALALTFPLPVTVAMLGPLDWGPVFGGYVAALFLAGAYIAIGLFVSSRTDNQIVSLLLSVLLCGLFLLIGSEPVCAIFPSQISEVLKLVGTGARFQSITRGVIDFRDLYYYLSIIGVFLTLNVFQLERLRWASNKGTGKHLLWRNVVVLFVANFIAGNFWLQQVSFARADLTEGHLFTISDTTRKYLSELKEPLLIRGYFSKKTHPLLAPLVPQLRDLLKEYALAGKGKVRVEFVDPLDKPELEREAGEKYGIKPVVFQASNKYQAAIVNSYFDVLVKYGDQYRSLSFRDLIEVKAQGETNVDVELRDPEYDITSAIKKVMSTYKSEGNLFQDIAEPVTFKGYISSDANLPEPLLKVKAELNKAIDQLKLDSKGKLNVKFEDPDADGGKLGKQLASDYGFRPMTLGLLDPRKFWFYMTLESGGQVVPVALPDEIDKEAIERGVKAGLKRFSKGFLKTVGICGETMDMQMFGMPDTKSKHFRVLREKLGSEYAVKSVTLDEGKVPSDLDVLLILAPEKLDDKKLFAVDQFLMRGGTVILSTAPFDVNFNKELEGHKINSGLSEWLKQKGIQLDETMVLDPHNSQFPIPIERTVAEYKVQQTVMVPYPYFVEITDSGMDKGSGITSGIDQITTTWASPIKLDEKANQGRTVLKLLSSSKDSWNSPSTNIQPDFEIYGKLGFPPGAARAPQLVGVAIEGQFDSYFQGKPSPLAKTSQTAPKGNDATEPPKPETNKGEAASAAFIEKSSKTSRIIVFASNSFLSDEMLELASASMGTSYLTPITLVENAVDWSLGDRDLLSIRGRAHFSRTLRLIDAFASQQLPVDWIPPVFEYANYFLAILGLTFAWIVRAIVNRRKRNYYREVLAFSPGKYTASLNPAAGTGRQMVDPAPAPSLQAESGASQLAANTVNSDHLNAKSDSPGESGASTESDKRSSSDEASLADHSRSSAK